jgi:hypothetical protein
MGGERAGTAGTDMEFKELYVYGSIVIFRDYHTPHYIILGEFLQWLFWVVVIPPMWGRGGPRVVVSPCDIRVYVNCYKYIKKPPRYC